jgi:hypothetical protein
MCEAGTGVLAAGMAAGIVIVAAGMMILNRARKGD